MYLHTTMTYKRGETLQDTMVFQWSIDKILNFNIFNKKKTLNRFDSHANFLAPEFKLKKKIEFDTCELSKEF